MKKWKKYIQKGKENKRIDGAICLKEGGDSNYKIKT